LEASFLSVSPCEQREQFQPCFHEEEEEKCVTYQLVDDQGEKIFLLLGLGAKEIVNHSNGLVLDEDDRFMGQGLQGGDEFQVAGLELTLEVPRQDGLII